MSSRITDEIIENIAILSKLEINREDTELVKKDMEAILNFVEKIEELDTDEVEPLSHNFKNVNVYRDDVVTNGDDRDDIMKNGPDIKDGYFVVPKTIG